MDGEFVMGGTGAGQEDSIVIAYMSGAYGLDIKYIPYDGGGAVAKDLAGKQIMATVNNPAEAKGPDGPARRLREQHRLRGKTRLVIQRYKEI